MIEPRNSLFYFDEHSTQEKFARIHIVVQCHLQRAAESRNDQLTISKHLCRHGELSGKVAHRSHIYLSIQVAEMLRFDFCLLSLQMLHLSEVLKNALGN